jgi:hypothetical protein
MSAAEITVDIEGDGLFTEVYNIIKELIDLLAGEHSEMYELLDAFHGIGCSESLNKLLEIIILIYESVLIVLLFDHCKRDAFVSPADITVNK